MHGTLSRSDHHHNQPTLTAGRQQSDFQIRQEYILQLWPCSHDMPVPEEPVFHIRQILAFTFQMQR